MWGMKIAGTASENFNREMRGYLPDGFTVNRPRRLECVLHTVCRIVRSMQAVDVTSQQVRSLILICKRNTKGRLSTRQMRTHPRLVE